MKELLEIGEGLRKDGVRPDIAALAVWLVAGTELQLALDDINKWVQESGERRDIFFGCGQKPNEPLIEEPK